MPLPEGWKSKKGPTWLLSRCSASPFAAAREWTAGKACGRQLYLTSQIKPRLGPSAQRFFRDGPLSSPAMACLCSLFAWVGLSGMGFWSAVRLWPRGMQLLYVHTAIFRGFEDKAHGRNPNHGELTPHLVVDFINQWHITDYPLQPACGPPPPQLAGVWCCEKVIDGNVSIIIWKEERYLMVTESVFWRWSPEKFRTLSSHWAQLCTERGGEISPLTVSESTKTLSSYQFLTWVDR